MKKIILIVVIFLLKTQGFLALTVTKEFPSPSNLKRSEKLLKEIKINKVNRIKTSCIDFLKLSPEELTYLRKLDLSDKFYLKLECIANKQKMETKWLFKVLWMESRLNHKAYNKTTKAYGLLQIIPMTAKFLGEGDLKNKNNLKQLGVIDNYFDVFGKAHKWENWQEVYLIVAFPAAVTKDKNWVFRSKNISAYQVAISNPYWDINKDNKITKKEFLTYIKNYDK